MYSAESVIAELKTNTELNCENIDKTYCPSLHLGCCGNPEDCRLCNNKECEQKISVHRDYKLLTILTFKFTISLINRDGFIPKDDSSLRRLINHKWIDESKLISIK